MYVKAKRVLGYTDEEMNSSRPPFMRKYRLGGKGDKVVVKDY